MKKTTISKKVLAGTLAATFALGLGYVGLNQSQAFAATSTNAAGTTDSAHTQQPPMDGKHGRGGFGFRGVDVMKEAATILGVDQTTLKDSMKTGGKSLADLASEKGLSEDDFLAQLNAAVTASMDAQVTAGTLTADQATQLKTNLADRLKQQVENKGGAGPVGDHNGMMDGGRGGMGGGHSKGGFGGFLNSDTLASLLGMTQDEIRTELDAGKTLVEIAQAKGISEDDLIAKLKDGMTDQIKQFVESKHQKPAQPQASADGGVPGAGAAEAPTVTQ